MNPQASPPAPVTTRPERRTPSDEQRRVRAGSLRLPSPDGVPFITRWSGETERPSPLALRRDGRGIRYIDERSYDRSAGVLWTRTPSQPGRGKPEFGAVHSLRQRLAMTGLLCQICGQPADRDAEGILWLIDAHAGDLHPRRERTTHPPVCQPCAVKSVHACPHLRRRWTAIRARTVTMCGVQGALYAPGPSAPVAVDDGSFEFTHPCLPWVRASQLIAELRDFTTVDL